VVRCDIDLFADEFSEKKQDNAVGRAADSALLRSNWRYPGSQKRDPGHPAKSKCRSFDSVWPEDGQTSLKMTAYSRSQRIQDDGVIYDAKFRDGTLVADDEDLEAALDGSGLDGAEAAVLRKDDAGEICDEVDVAGG
jgi:hypothetical protein